MNGHSEEVPGRDFDGRATWVPPGGALTRRDALPDPRDGSEERRHIDCRAMESVSLNEASTIGSARVLDRVAGHPDEPIEDSARPRRRRATARQFLANIYQLLECTLS